MVAKPHRIGRPEAAQAAGQKETLARLSPAAGVCNNQAPRPGPLPSIGGRVRFETRNAVTTNIPADRTVRVAPPSLQTEVRPWCLVVVSGTGIGSRFELGEFATIGREAGVDIRIAEPSVSRSHCRVWRKRGGYWVTDLGATNPTRVNGMKVESMPLLEGDILTVGDIMLKMLGPRSPENALVAALHDQATRDTMTGLANRRFFRAAMEREFASSQRGKHVALLVVDVDHFKTINDRWGHPVGDRVLVAVAKTMVDRLRSSDLAGRIGGEEFAVLLPDTGAEDGMRVAEMLREALGAMVIEEGGQPIPVTVSIGVAVASLGSDTSADVLYARADASLYESKRTGRNKVTLSAG